MRKIRLSDIEIAIERCIGGDDFDAIASIDGERVAEFTGFDGRIECGPGGELWCNSVVWLREPVGERDLYQENLIEGTFNLGEFKRAARRIVRDRLNR